MKKAEFKNFCLTHARWARQTMIARKGDFPQHAIIVDLRGNLHVIVFTEVLHGYRMRDTLMVMALAKGGADAFLVMADARVSKGMSREEEQRVREQAARGIYIIAEDEANQEILTVIGRSHEHILLIHMPYRREVQSDGGCLITFDDPEPQIIDADWNVESDMLPNPWGRFH